MTLSNEFINVIEAVLGKRVRQAKSFTPSFYLFLIAHELDTALLEGVFAKPHSMFTLGVGKSVYCLKTAYYVYKKNWNTTKQYIVFMPQDFLARFEDAIDNKYRIPIIIWDDAGFWIGRQRWQSKFVRAIREFMNVIRTHIVYLMINAPRITELARGVREQLNFVSFIRLFNYTSDIYKRASLAELYEAVDADYVVSRKIKPSPLSEFVFKTYFEQYNDYKEMREKYVEIGKTRAEEALKEIADEAARELREVAGKAEPNARLDSVVDEEEVVEEIEEVLNEEEE